MRITKIDVPVNKQNLISFKDKLEILKSSHNILEDRYEELRKMLDNLLLYYQRERRDLEKSLTRAYDNLTKTFLHIGKTITNLKSYFCKSDFNFEIKKYTKFGVKLIDAQFLEDENFRIYLNYGFADTSPILERTRDDFIKTLKDICILAVTENVLQRISRELRKTRKKIIALDNIFIPDYEETIKYMEFVLEEKERYNIVVKKLIKEKLEEKEN
ncbi:MAG: hypothetical protein GF329_17585 [Candidatus Lokiarchaeota archaeon]|nr:hypothetical protein [Candidatus Lokiarchaeota archaeon]